MERELKAERLSFGHALESSSIVISSLGDTSDSKPLLKRFCDSIYFNVFNYFSVLNLQFLVSPAAITRFVISVIVNPVNRVFRGRLTLHVFKKISKAIFAKPPITYPYTSTAIPVISTIRFLIAPHFHSSPRVELIPVFRETRTSFKVTGIGACLIRLATLKTTVFAGLSKVFIGHKLIATGNTPKGYILNICHTHNYSVSVSKSKGVIAWI